MSTTGSTADWRLFPDLNSAPAEVIFRLPASHGRIVALDGYRQRQGVCLLFLPQDDSARWQGHLEALAEARAELSERDAAPLAVLPVDQATAAIWAGRLSQPLLLLADEDGQVRRRYLTLAPDIDPDAAFVFLLDRWSAPLAVGPAEEGWVGEALDWFDLALTRCPE